MFSVLHDLYKSYRGITPDNQHSRVDAMLRLCLIRYCTTRLGYDSVAAEKLVDDMMQFVKADL